MRAEQGIPEAAAFVHLLRGRKALPPSSDTGTRGGPWDALLGWAEMERGPKPNALLVLGTYRGVRSRRG